MENNKPLDTGPDKDTMKVKKEMTATASAPPEVNSSVYMDTKKDWNAKILKMTLMIREEYPELSKFLNEMPVTVPDESHPEVELNNLKQYYESLHSLLNKYRLEHPHTIQK